jgi:hypothetical protein
MYPSQYGGIRLFDGYNIQPVSINAKLTSGAVNVSTFKSVSMTVIFEAGSLAPSVSLQLQSTNEDADYVSTVPSGTILPIRGGTVVATGHAGNFSQPGVNGNGGIGWINIPTAIINNNGSQSITAGIMTMTATGPYSVELPFPFQDRWIRGVLSVGTGTASGVMTVFVCSKA